LLLPALSKAKQKAQGTYCMNNEKQLALAAIEYADDNNDHWIPNFPGQDPNWVVGKMDWNASNPDNTNYMLLVDPIHSVLGQYIKNYKIFHCPSDPSYVQGEGQRVRSVSASQSVGTVYASTGQLSAGDNVNGQWLPGANVGANLQTTWRTFGRTSDMTIPDPSRLFIFLDEHPDSINDPQFAVQMAYVGPFAKIIDVPASYHNGAGGFSFCDGHAEVHRWIGSTIQKPVVNGGANIGNNAQPANDSAVDVLWLQQRASSQL
jgi:prepilin-type processing-associated H-X9-DG protein